MADRGESNINRAEDDRRDPSRGKGGGRKSGMGRGRGRSHVRHQPDYWSLAQPEFRLWLANITTKAEYNKLPIAERRELLRDFGISQQRSDGELRGLLQRFLASHADPYVAVSATHYSRDDSQSVQAASIAYYGLCNEKFCQVLGAVDRNRVSVINAHIWPRSAAQDLILFDLQPAKIHDERNVLRLQKDIERAFDHRELTFVENDEGALVVKVINPDILSETLTGTTMTFNDIQGTPLLLPSGKNPFRRLIAHHSILSHKNARTQGWIGDDLSEVEVKAGALIAHSLDEEAQARLKLLWNATPT
mmetsp:Transcript_2256/g.6362  ORF Transcript_2256/g.6362 Transcript_2256/m.6362 type:complete len:305 (-) Transcript_2256:2001-2915(-)